MISSFRIVLYSLIVIALQVWVFNPVSIFAIGTPYIYVLLLMLFPMQTSINKLLLYAFAIGTVIDILSLTPGLHTAVFVPVAFIRFYAVKPFIDKKESLDYPPLFPHIASGSIILLFELLIIQHILLFLIDSIGLFEWEFLLKRAGVSLLFSGFFSLIFMFIFSAHLKSKS